MLRRRTEFFIWIEYINQKKKEKKKTICNCKFYLTISLKIKKKQTAVFPHLMNVYVQIKMRIFSTGGLRGKP